MTINMTALWDALGWAILHSLWQGAAIGALVWLVRALLTERRATGRYLTGMIGLGLTGIAFFGTFVWLAMNGAAPLLSLNEAAPPTSNPVIAAGEVFVAIRALPTNGLQLDMIGGLIPILGMIWLAGFAFLTIQACRAWSHTRWLASHGLRSPGAEWTGRFEALIRKSRATERVRLFVSDHVAGPMTLGALRPIVLVPAGFLTGLPSAQVEAILLHELAHIRRHDFLFGLFQTAIRTALYFNPAVWLMSRAIDADREQACDDMAVKVSGQAVDLVRGLAALRLQSAAPSLAMAADGGPLMTRLNRLMGRSSSKPLLRTASNRLSAAALSALMLGTAACTSVSMASPLPVDDQTAPPAAPETPAALPDTVIRSQNNRTFAQAEPPATPKPPSLQYTVDAHYQDAELPPMPVMPDVPEIPPVPAMPEIAFGPDGDMEDFEEAMEAWGEKMEAWGEKVESRFEGDWEDEMEAWGDEVEVWAEALEAEGIIVGNNMVELEDLANLDALKALEGLKGLEGLAALEALSELEVLSELEALSGLENLAILSGENAERNAERVERQREQIERDVERAMERAERQRERAEREVERQVEQAERHAELRAEHAERQAELMERDIERRIEEEMRRESLSRRKHSSQVTVYDDQKTIMMAGKTVNVEGLREALYDALQSDGLIRSDRSTASLLVTSDKINVNGRNVTETQRQRYLEIISEAGLCPDESLTIRLTDDATRIVMSSDGEHRVTTTVGTFDHDSK